MSSDPSSPSARVLVVDDFEPFRQLIRTQLQQQPVVSIVGEASDGESAVEQTQTLHPDLILLDIGLPKQNGLDAARLMRQDSPHSKILFVSQESSADIVQAAFRMGAYGYVVKTDVGAELLDAVREVLLGNQFASSSVKAHVSSNQLAFEEPPTETAK
jgi:DNA-binding NarL/FixJ family response regulator